MRYFAMIFWLLAAPAMAAEKREGFEFIAYWSGLEVGAMQLELVENADEFRYIAAIEARGLAKFASKYKSHNVATGKLGANYPSEYHSSWTRKKKGQEILLQFSKAGDVVFEQQTPPEFKGKRPEVPAELKKAVLDPVSGGVFALRQVQEALKSGEKKNFTVQIYDAKRRFDAKIEFLGAGRPSFADKNREFEVVRLTREPLAGFREREIKEIQEDEGQVIDFYLDKNALPIYAVANAGLGTAVIHLKNHF